MDTTFNPALTAPVSSGYSLAAVAEDGTYYFQNSDAGNLVKVSASGDLDTGYNPPVTSDFGGQSGYFEAKPLAGNSLLLTGNFKVSGTPAIAAKLLSDGTVDPAFTPIAPPPGDTYLVEAIMLDNGDLLLNHWGYDDDLMSSSGGVKAVRANGQLVAGFPPAGPLSYARVQADGKILVAGSPLQVDGQTRLLARYGGDYQRDATFNAPAFVYAEGADFTFNVRDFAQGYFLVMESFSGSDVTFNGLPAKRLYRIQSHGGLAPDFTPWSPEGFGEASVATYHIDDFAVDAEGDGRVLIRTVVSGEDASTVRFHLLDAATGAVDTAFNPIVSVGSYGRVYGELAAGGVRVFVEEASQVNGEAVPDSASFALLGPTGSVTSYDSTSFPLLEGVNPWNPGPRGPVSSVQKMTLSDGSILIISTDPPLTHVNGQPASGMLRILADGTLDTDFALIPGSSTGYHWVSVHEEAGLRLILTGNFTSINGVARPGVARVSLTAVAGPVEWAGFYTLSSDPAVLSSTDSDQDGVLDLLELAFRLHPRQADGTAFDAASGRGLPAASLQPGAGGMPPKLRLTFPRRRDRVALGLTYAPVFGSSPWDAGVAGVEVSAVPVAGNDTWEIVVVEDPGVPDGQIQRFARVRVGL